MGWIMKILVISSNTLPATPSGPVYVAGAVRQAGHEVQIYERLFSTDLAGELTAKLMDFQPDIVGISIRLVFGDELDLEAPLGTRHTDLRPRVKEFTDFIRQTSPAHIVLGGPGFNYYARDWLEYLDLDYGICGEGEESFPLFLKRLAEGGDITSVPGCVFRNDGCFDSVPPRPVKDLDKQALPAYDLLDWQSYAGRNITPAVLTKRGCAFSCTYCLYSKLEGKRYRSKIPFGASLILGAPGETPETIAETLDVLDDYEIPNGVWVTVGVYLWTDYQEIVPEARRTGVLKDDNELFSGAVYLSPDLPRSYLQELPEALRARRGYWVQFNKPSEAWTL